MIKTLDGETAPIKWQQGEYDLVQSYCENDVLIEAGTLNLLLKGELVDPNNGCKLKPPQCFIERLMNQG